MKKGMKGILLCIAMIMAVMLAMVPAKTVHAASSGTSGTCSWEISDDGVLRIFPTDGVSGQMGSFTSVQSPWAGSSTIKKVIIEPGVKSGQSCNYCFYQLKNCTEMDLHNLDLSETTSAAQMFVSCSSLKKLDISGWNTSNLRNISGMFWGCGFETIDLSGFDTKNVTDMSYLFDSCRNLKSVNLSGWNTEKVEDMHWLFDSCNKLESVDISDFNTPKLTTSYSMFNGCSNLTEVDMSNFDTRKGSAHYAWFANCSKLKSVTLSPNITIDLYLPDPPKQVPYLGKWVRADLSVGPLTARELSRQYAANSEAWAGKWVWAEGDPNGYVVFDGNGGVISGNTKITFSASEGVHPFTTLTEDVTKFPGRFLLGWSEDASATSPTYEPGVEINIAEFEKTKTLYAIWTAEGTTRYHVEHQQQNYGLDGYTLAEKERLYGEAGSSVTPAVKSYEGFAAPSTQTVTLAADGSTVVTYKYDRLQYKVHFDGNGATSGQLADQKFLIGVGGTLRPNNYSKKGSIFTGWNTAPDGSGTSYTNGANVVDLTTEHGSTVTLYAQWLDNSDHASEPTDGAVRVTLKAGQTVVIPDLPAGTTYTIREVNNPDGWSFDHTDGETGTIQANKTNDATVYNVYHAVGSVPVMIYKDVVGPDGSHKDFEAGSFAFAIVRQSDAKVMGTAWNDSIDTEEYLSDEEGNQVPNPHYGLASVEFQPLTFDESDIGQTYTYLIGEINTPEGYEVSEPILLTVKVEDAGHGQLNVTASYDHEQKIVNTDTQSGTLRISKDILNAGDNNAEFTFKVDLKDAEGNPLAGTYRAGLDVLVQNGPYYSHTENINDAGEKQGDYVSSKNYADIITIPGAEKLHVTVKYTNPRGYFWIWQGAHEEVYSGTNGFGPNFSNSSAIKSYMYQQGRDYEYLTDEFDVDGDTLSLLYNSYAYQESQGYYPNGPYSDMVNYGYYMTVTGMAGTEFQGNTDFHSGDTVTLHGGEHIDIYDLPVGTTYSVSEINIPERWGLISSVGENGTIPNGQTVTASFINSYGEELTGVAYLTGQKNLIGKDLTAGEFLFEVVDSEGNSVSMGTNDATGKITFEAIPYTESQIGEHQYTVREVIPEEHEGDGITYDEKSYVVTVNVSKGDNTLVCDVSYPEDVVFNNTYTASTEITVSGQKVLEGRDFRESDKWTFTISGDGPLPEQPSVEIRPYQFDRFGFAIPFTVADLEGQQSKEFTYTVKESGSVVFVANDTSEKTFTVRVTDNGQGVLKAELVDADNLDLTFTNKATVTLPATGSTTAIVLTIVGVVVIAGGLFFLLHKRKDDDEDE